MYNKTTHTVYFSIRKHWDSIVQKLIHAPDEQRLKDNLPDSEKEMVTDMLMLMDAQKEYGNKALGITVWEHKSTEFLYDNAGNIDCHKGRSNKVAHLSHHACHSAYESGVYPDLDGKKVTKRNVIHQRHEAAQKMMEDFRSKCLEQTTE